MRFRNYLALGFLGFGSIFGTVSCQGTEPRPNFVFILADDLGWNDVGYHGSQIQTPNLDRLARDGIRLNQHYAHPVCSPTRAALLTGRSASRFGIHGAIAGSSKQFLPPKAPNLPQLLRENGYRTHISGKWHLALTQEFGPTTYGFETSYGYLHGQIDPYTHLYKFGDRTWHRNDQLIEEEGHATDLITRDAVSFIRNAGQAPFFLYVAYSVPHYPLAEPDEWTNLYEDKLEERSRVLYAASTTHMDDGIGQILEVLEEEGILGQTLLVFSSDNGGQKNWMNTGELYGGRYDPNPALGDNTPLRGWKGDLYEGGIRVPALAYWSGQLAPGELDEPVSIADWFPTFAAYAACREGVPQEIDGRNIQPLLEGQLSAFVEKPIYIRSSSGRMLRSGNWKLIESREGQLALFNINEDPSEEVDLASQETKKVDELKLELDKIGKLDAAPWRWNE